MTIQVLKTRFQMVLGILMVMLVGCATRYTPPPVNPDANVGHSVSIYKSFVFDEQFVPIRACLQLRSVEDTSFEPAYVHAVQKHLEAHGVEVVENSQNADVTFDIYVKLEEITPEPQCRMKQHIMMTVKDNKGEPLLIPWTHDVIMPEGVSTIQEAKRQVWDYSIRALSDWIRVNFYIMTVTEKAWVSSVLRIKQSRGVFHSDKRGEEIATRMLYDIKSLRGVIDVTLVEKDTQAMMFSYRVFYNRQKLVRPLNESLGMIKRKYE